MKKSFVLLSLVLCLCMLTACAGTPVIYHDSCDCPIGGTPSSPSNNNNNPDPSLPAPEGALKTGLAILTNIGDSKSANAESDGEAKYDVTMAAVLVDEDGIIRDCVIDGISASVKFNTSGQITSDLTKPIKTKNELGASYGMVSWGGAIAEWDAQADAFANYVIGKTAAEVAGIAVNDQNKPTDADLSTSVTISVGGFMSAVQKAVANAKHLGAKGGDTLTLAAIPSTSASNNKSATADKNGTAQLDADVTALTMKDGKITSCALDSVQAKVAFNASGAVTTDLNAAVKTKNELGADYNMVAWGGAIAEWNEQAASFAAYITGKTPEQVANIAVNESTKPTDADLSTSVTIAIGGFQALIQKATK